MKPTADCASCVLHWVYERASFGLDENERFRLMQDLLKVIAREFKADANLGLICNRIVEAVQEFITSAKRYEAIKSKTNRYVHSLLPASREFIEGGKTPRERFERACYLASAGNVAPMGAPSEPLRFDEVEKIIAEGHPLPEMTGDAYGASLSASHVLYVTDNAGEIGFDSLLIAKLKELGLKVSLVVKEPHFFEDVTPEDASFFGLDKLVDNMLTTKGVFIPGKGSKALIDAFKACDLIITKGTGNYEAIKGEVKGKPTLYMLKIKCAPLAEEIGVDVGGFIVKLEE